MTTWCFALLSWLPWSEKAPWFLSTWQACSMLPACKEKLLLWSDWVWLAGNWFLLSLVLSEVYFRYCCFSLYPQSTCLPSSSPRRAILKIGYFFPSNCYQALPYSILNKQHIDIELCLQGLPWGVHNLTASRSVTWLVVTCNRRFLTMCNVDLLCLHMIQK